VGRKEKLGLNNTELITEKNLKTSVSDEKTSSKNVNNTDWTEKRKRTMLNSGDNKEK
jgi:hypothetical protein